MDAVNYYQPFLLPPNRVWRAYTGGKLLDEIEHKPDPSDGNFPEDWIGSATQAINPEQKEGEGIGRARSADGKEYRMDALLAAQPRASLGASHVEAFGTSPQLLVKYVDSSVRLHIQAHPSIDWSMKHLNDTRGKTEAWWVLGSRHADPYVYFGFQNPPTPAQWERMMQRQDSQAMLECFEKVPVSAGDILLIEAGIPHAIGEGLFVLEIQEPTDYVVKSEFSAGGVRLSEETATMGFGINGVLDLFDYNACPADGIRARYGPRPRTTAASGGSTETVMLEAPQTGRVELRRIECYESFSIETDGRYSILIVLEGDGSVAAGDVSVPVAQWTKLFVPACVDTIRFCGSMRIARCLPPLP